MKNYFTTIALLLVAVLVTIMQATAAPVENSAVNEQSNDVSTQDAWKALYDKYYASLASRSLAARDVAEPAQLFPFPPFPPFPPPPTFPPFPPPPTFPPFPPFPPFPHF
ncbi:hypothetical protein [Parasitella parasitica]|uniref:Uncharacterized protein n=1 Tax=Parasitella parasitica TaxID=35722 RepID=A0A0B7N1P1_9FUNG|nr:hypothetical protein [Parasitella parasitica]